MGWDLLKRIYKNNGSFDMERKHNSRLTNVARILRKNMTKEEKHLWYDFLRTYPIKFTRQKVLGKYVADFYSAKANIVIELDGSEHFTTNGEKYDSKRTKFLENYGIKVIRIPNTEINNNFESICNYIDEIITKTTMPK